MTVLALVGLTGSGKSSLAIDVARRRQAQGRPTEVVAIDAFTIYRGMDVGTAKPPRAIRDEIPHHLVDIVEPDEDVSVATFQRLARAAIADVQRRGVTPLLVGGSGLYWRAVVDDLAFPPTDASVRQRLESAWQHDPAGAHRALADRDPAAASRIEADNLRRTIRALEVIELTGRRFSSYRTSWDDFVSVYADLRVGYLEPRPDEARASIAARARRMVDDGLLDEARRLREGGLSRTAKQAIGYAEAFAVLDAMAPAASLAEAITRRTWRYARRQRSWFRADPRCVPQTPSALIAAMAGDHLEAQHENVDGARDGHDVGE